MPQLTTPGEIAILGEEATNVDRRGVWIALEEGGVECRPPLKTRCPEFESVDVGRNSEAGMMLYPGSPGWLIVCGTADESPPGPGSTLD